MFDRADAAVTIAVAQPDEGQGILPIVAVGPDVRADIGDELDAGAHAGNVTSSKPM
jgi:hypothetical protein